MDRLVTLFTSFASARAKEEAIPPATFDMLEQVRDTFLYTGEYGLYMYWFAIIGYCLANGKAILSAQQDINFFHGLALQLMTSYGGSSVTAIICGKPVAFFINESLAPVRCTCTAPDTPYSSRPPPYFFDTGVAPCVLCSLLCAHAAFRADEYLHRRHPDQHWCARRRPPTLCHTHEAHATSL